MIKLKNLHQSLVFLIVTFFCVGKIKKAPGTFGSIASFPFIWLVFLLTSNFNVFIHINSLDFNTQFFLGFIINLLMISGVLFFIGAYTSDIYMQTTNTNDPKEIVIDEVVGQMITFALITPSVVIVRYSDLTKYFSENMIDFFVLIAMPFLLFRLFDIVKPWPIKLVEQKYKNGYGVMVDDVLAAFFAVIIHYAIVFVVIDLTS